MNDLMLALRQVKYENRSFWRNPPAAFFTFALPLMFLVVVNSAFGDDTIDLPGGTSNLSTFYIPAIAALAVITASYTNIAMRVAISRDQGLLKRTRGTPLPIWAFLFGRILHATLIALLLVAIVTAAGALFYDVDVPTNTMPAFLLTLVVGAATFSGLGFAITTVITNAQASPAIVNGTILPLFFISDVFIRTDDAPGWLNTVGDLFPVKHFSEALQTVFNPFETGPGFEFGDLAVMAAWGLVGLLVAMRFFSWQPHR